MNKRQSITFPAINPVDVDKHTWLYEERGGLCVVREALDPNGQIIPYPGVLTQVFYLPWAQLDKLVARWKKRIKKVKK